MIQFNIIPRSYCGRIFSVSELPESLSRHHYLSYFVYFILDNTGDPIVIKGARGIPSYWKLFNHRGFGNSIYSRTAEIYGLRLSNATKPRRPNMCRLWFTDLDRAKEFVTECSNKKKVIRLKNWEDQRQLNASLDNYGKMPDRNFTNYIYL